MMTEKEKYMRAAEQAILESKVPPYVETEYVKSSFHNKESVFQVIAFANVKLLDELNAEYGETLEDGKDAAATIFSHWDDEKQTKRRAAILNKTLLPIDLDDGRIAIQCLFTEAFLAALPLDGVEQLTQEQFDKLKPNNISE